MSILSFSIYQKNRKGSTCTISSNSLASIINIFKLRVSICFQKRNDGQPTYNVIDVWERNITGAGVVIAVVDEGLDPEHPELKANYVSYSTL